MIWYGNFNPAQRSIILDLFQSLNRPGPPSPSVASWWHTTASYKGGPCNVALLQVGKSLKEVQIVALASKPGEMRPTGINVVLTDADVAVEDFCVWDPWRDC
ncbi:hypothetical protein BUALT_Bualt04G0065800 [Buddleja alternifolia]|uniref:Uncharacterized protein n=1 Tax=Buddleja alternifolia TaxID=168488 RepID=A0AAV6XLT6_9LAMI|nr:hypothetical protein BUALT_Bualt04G0065800 [Buddleja alternifolia]